MRRSPNTYRTLHEKLPGLRMCLMKTLGKNADHLTRLYSAEEEDDLPRSHYVQVEGRRVKRNLSTVDREHIIAFFNKIFWTFHAYYGNETHENVTIIVAYKEARSCWQQALRHIMRAYKMTSGQLPHVMIIDSLQDTEAQITIVDCSVQQYRKNSYIGFVDDDRRVNVAMTRAQEVRWILGGSCSASQRSDRPWKLPAYFRFCDHSELKDSLSIFSGGLSRGDGADWLQKLKKHRVVLQKTFADDRWRLVGN